MLLQKLRYPNDRFQPQTPYSKQFGRLNDQPVAVAKKVLLLWD